MALVFNAEHHQYTHDGIIVPSVTQVLNEWVKVERGRYSYYVSTFDGTVIDADIFERAGRIGSAVHKGANILINNRFINWDKLSPDLVHPLSEFKRWMSDYEVKVIVSETPMYSKKYGIAGTPDLVCTIKGISGHILPDYKTSDMAPLVGPQTAIYEDMYRENYKYRGIVKRYMLHLPKNTSKQYKFKPLTGKNDLAYFKSKLFEYNWRRNK
jgi:hypothetical protein